MGEPSPRWIGGTVCIIPGWDGMLPQVLGAAWGKDGSELGQLAGCVGICCALPKMGDSERVMCSGSRGTAERRVASLRRLGWDA
jgi:hypothetical protein